MKKMILVKDKTPKKSTEKTTTVTSTPVQPRDPRLMNRYNPSFKKDVITDYKYNVQEPDPVVSTPITNPGMQNDGYYTTDDKGNRIYDENTYTSGGSRAKTTATKAIAKVPIPEFSKGVKKMKMKRKY